MQIEGWYRAEDDRFVVGLAGGWAAEPDEEEGGVAIWHPDGAGELHLIGFALPPGELPDPGEELFAFLDEQGVELAEDEVEDVSLAVGELAYCEYVSEEEDAPDAEDGATYWMVGVAAIPGALVFAHYSCAAGEEAGDHDALQAMLRTLRPAEA